MKIVYFVLIGCFAMMQSSCHTNCPDADDPVPVANLTKCEESLIPYVGDEVLRFISQGDSFHFKGTGLRISNERGFLSGGDCGTSYTQVVKNYAFEGTSFWLFFKLTPSLYTDRTTLKITSNLDIPHQIFSSEIEDCPSLGTYYLKYDSIIINKTSYKNVFARLDSSAFYNVSHGLLRFKRNGKTFERIQ